MNPYAQYHKTSIETAKPGRLVILLYDGAIRFCRQAMAAIDIGKIEEAHLKIVRVQQILNELSISLNRSDGEEIAENLFNLYEYMQHQLLIANVRKDKKLIEEVIGLLMTLRSAWQEIFNKSSKV